MMKHCEEIITTSFRVSTYQPGTNAQGNVNVAFTRNLRPVSARA